MRRASHAFLLLAAPVLASCSTQALPNARSIERIDVLGAAEVPEEDIEAKIATAETKRLLGGVLEGVPLFTALDALTVEYQFFDRFVLQRDLERIRRFYRSRGFYEAQVRAARVVPLPEERVRIEIEVEEGTAVLLDVVEFEFPGWEQAFDTNASLREILATYEAEPVVKDEGRPRFDEERYEAVKQELLRALTGDGFAYARLEGKVSVDLPTHRAKVAFRVESGPPCQFGEVRLEGLGEIPEAPIRRAIGIEPGEPYSTEQLELAQRALADFGVFGSVEIAAELDRSAAKPATVVPVVVRLRPVKLRAVKLGLGTEIGSQIDVHAIAGWEDRNFVGGLRRFSTEIHPGLVFFPTRAETIFSQVATDVLPKAKLQLDFVQPGFPEALTNTLLGATFNIYPSRNNAVPDPVPEDFNILGYRELDARFGVDRRFHFGFWGGSVLYLGQFLKLVLSDPFSYNQDDTPPGIAAVVIPYLETEAFWDFRTGEDGKLDAIHPERGVYVGTNFQVAAVGDAEDVKLRPELRAYAPLAKKTTLALRFGFGFLFPRNYGGALDWEIPPATISDADKATLERDLQMLSFRALFSGGPSSNRGYGYREVGPYFNFATLSTDPAEATDPARAKWQPTGGQGMWEASIEVRFPLGGNIGAAAFLDASDVSRAISGFRLDHPHLCPGVGLRIDTPVGPFRLDLGVRVPYLQRVGEPVLEPEEGGSPTGQVDSFPVALSLAIGEAY